MLVMRLRLVVPSARQIQSISPPDGLSAAGSRFELLKKETRKKMLWESEGGDESLIFVHSSKVSISGMTYALIPVQDKAV